MTPTDPIASDRSALLKFVLEQRVLHRRLRIEKIIDLDELAMSKHDTLCRQVIADMQRELRAEIDRLQRRERKEGQ